MAIITNIAEEKEAVNYIINNGLKEILYKGLRVEGGSIGMLEDNINMMLRALQLKNKIYDFACMIKENSLLKRYEGTIVYDLINTTEDQYSEEITFYF